MIIGIISIIIFATLLIFRKKNKKITPTILTDDMEREMENDRR